jgi:hypothetical protein
VKSKKQVYRIRNTHLACGIALTFAFIEHTSAQTANVPPAAGNRPARLVTWPSSGQYTTASLPLPNGEPACVVLMKPRPIGGRISYDISIWRQRASMHLWLTSHGRPLPVVNAISIVSSGGLRVRVPITNRAQPGRGADAISADIDQSLLERLAGGPPESRQTDWRLSVGPEDYLIPRQGFREALRQLADCSTKL